MANYSDKALKTVETLVANYEVAKVDLEEAERKYSSALYYFQAEPTSEKLNKLRQALTMMQTMQKNYDEEVKLMHEGILNADKL